LNVGNTNYDIANATLKKELEKANLSMSDLAADRDAWKEKYNQMLVQSKFDETEIKELRDAVKVWELQANSQQKDLSTARQIFANFAKDMGTILGVRAQNGLEDGEGDIGASYPAGARSTRKRVRDSTVQEDVEENENDVPSPIATLANSASSIRGEDGPSLPSGWHWVRGHPARDPISKKARKRAASMVGDEEQ